MHAQSLRNAGAEAIGLDQSGDQGANIIDAGAIDEIAQGFGARFAGAHFEVDQVEFVAEVGMSVMQVFSDAHQGLIKGEAGLHANYGEVECIGQRDPDALLAILDQALQVEARKEEAERRNADQQGDIVDSGEYQHPDKAQSSQQKAGAEIVADVAGFAQSSLNQPGAGAGDVGRRQRNRFAEGIEGLLQTLLDLIAELSCTWALWPPRARKRAPSTELGVMTAAPKENTTSTTVTNTTMVRINGIYQPDLSVSFQTLTQTWILIILRITK